MDAVNWADWIPRDVLVISLEYFLGRTDFNLSQNLEVTKATSQVEGFLSTILRVKTSYKIEGEETVHRKSLIFKMLPKVSLESFNVKEAFHREASFFDMVLPLVKESSARKVDIPFPNCYYVKYEGVEQVIVMEDLKERGFQTPDRIYLSQGLDLAHCKLSMACIGKLHALVTVAEKNLPSGDGTWADALPSMVKEGLFYISEDGEMEAPMYGLVETGIKTILELSDKIEGLPKEAKASGMLEKVFKGLWNTICKFVKSDPKGPNLLNHGDYWTFNLMFKYADDGSGRDVPVDMKTIDLQMARYCHPCVDIIYLLYSCTKKSLRDTHMDSLLSTYHESLVETMKTLEAGPPPISLEDLCEEVRNRYRPLGVSTAVIFAPLLLLGDDFLPTDSDQLTKEKLEEILTAGNSTKVLERFTSDLSYRSEIEALIREFVEVALPNGPNSIENSPFFD